MVLAAALPVLGQNRAQEKVRGEEMLRRAQADRVEANRLSEAAVVLSQKAQQDQAAAAEKRQEAIKLQREAFLLIHDANRAKAAELIGEAEEQEALIKVESVHLTRLKAELMRELKANQDANNTATHINEVSQSEPTEKAELSKMAATFGEQAAGYALQARGTEAQIKPLEQEIQKLEASAQQKRDMAQKLAPGIK